MEQIGDTVFISAPRASTFEVERPGPAEVADSERYWKIEKQEDALTGQLGELEEATRRKNREFDEKLRAIEERALALDSGIHTEARDSQGAHEEVLALIGDKLNAAVHVIESEAESAITARFDPGMDHHLARLETGEKRLNEFVHTTIPAVVDEQSGTVTRKLRKAHETFDIENAKIAKREKKIESRFQAHARATAQSFEDEEATRSAKLWLLGEDIQATENMDTRGDDRTHVSMLENLRALRVDMTKLSKDREYEDGLLLDSLADAQQKLQECILDTFGSREEGGNAALR